jgi:hypothetical protein
MPERARPLPLYFLALLVCGCFSQMASAQTPSARLFQPGLPQFRTILGLASELQPAYDGSRAYRVEGGPDINVYYRDIAFISTGDGIGYNILRGDHF